MPTKPELIAELLEIYRDPNLAAGASGPGDPMWSPGPQRVPSKTALNRMRKADLVNLLDRLQDQATRGYESLNPFPASDPLKALEELEPQAERARRAARPAAAGRGGQLLFDFGEELEDVVLDRPQPYVPWSQREIPGQMELDDYRRGERKLTKKVGTNKLRRARARLRAGRMKHPKLAAAGRLGLKGLGWLGVALEADAIMKAAGAAPPSHRDALADLVGGGGIISPDPQMLEMAALKHEKKALDLAEAWASGRARGQAAREAVPFELQFLTDPNSESVLRKAAVDGASTSSLYEVAANSGLI